MNRVSADSDSGSGSRFFGRVDSGSGQDESVERYNANLKNAIHLRVDIHIGIISN
jgi:hypothetical protein